MNFTKLERNLILQSVNSIAICRAIFGRVLLLAIITFFTLNVHAQKCADFYAKPSSFVYAHLEFVSDFMDAKRISIDVALKTLIKTSSRNEIASSLQRHLLKIKNMLVKLNLYSEPSMQVALKSYFEMIQSLQEEINIFKSSGTYLESLKLSYKITSLAEVILPLISKSVEGDLTVAEIQEQIHFYRNAEVSIWLKKFINEEAKVALQSKDELVFLPTDKDLSIDDFLELVGSGISPIGLVQNNVTADGKLWSPSLFLRHDVDHAISSMIGRQGIKNIKFWRTLLRKVNSLSDRQTTDLIKALLFYVTHESTRTMASSFISGDFKNVFPSLKSSLSKLKWRLKSENNWDLLSLQNLAVTENDLQKAFDILMSLSQSAWKNIDQ